MTQNPNAPQAVSKPTLPIPVSLITELATLHPLADLDREDVPLPYWSYNVKLKDAEGKWLPRDVFVNSITEEIRAELNCVLLAIHKHRRYAEYEEGIGTRLLCRSLNRMEGITDQGEIRECAACPLKDWGAGHGREAAPKCGVVYDLLALDAVTGQPAIIRAKGTSLRPVRKYIACHFAGKLQLEDGANADLPLFTIRTRLSLVMPSGNYSILSLNRENVCTEDEIRTFKRLHDQLNGTHDYQSDEDISENGDSAE